MHADLEAFLRDVWKVLAQPDSCLKQLEEQWEAAVAEQRRIWGDEDTKAEGDAVRQVPSRAALTVHGIIYKMYNKDDQTPLDKARASDWIKELRRIGIGKTWRTVQSAEGDGNTGFEEAYTSFVTGKDDDLTRALTKGFIHFENCQPHAPGVNFRIYINVNTAAGGQYAFELLRTLVDEIALFPYPTFWLPPALPETEESRLLKTARSFNSLKIAGPLNLGTRSDSIVIYCPTKECSDAIIKLLKGGKYRSFWFSPETPRMTQKVLGGVGISCAEEPPQVHVGIRDTDKQSFGGIRAEIITKAVLEALRRGRLTSDPTSFASFCGEVYKYFVKYGLDPESPWTNLPPAAT